MLSLKTLKKAAKKIGKSQVREEDSSLSSVEGGGVWVEDFGRITWFSRCERLFSVN